MVPLTGADKLVFLRNVGQGDTHTFVGNGWQKFWATKFTKEDCPETQKRELVEAKYSCTTFPSELVINQAIPDNRTSTSSLIITFNATVYKLTAISGLGYNNATVVINGKSYSGVDSFSNNSLSPVPSNYQCYYNRTDGIIKMLLSNGEEWSLISKN
jgi:hypothetical protein